MLDLFGSSDDEIKIKKIKADSKASRLEKKKIFRQSNRDNICLNAINNLPCEDEVLSFVSKGLSDAGSFLYAVHKIDGVIEEAIIATWTISKVNIKKILEYIDSGKIKKLSFLMNDGLLKTNSTKPIYAFMVQEFDKRKDKIKYVVANSHAKIQMYKTSKRYITISGSGNWSENPRIENYILIGGKKQFDFNSKWIKDLM